MSVVMTKTVRELTAENPGAARIFEKLGIDYCCGGNQLLQQACERAKLPIEQVLDSLEMAEQTARPADAVRDWNAEPLSELITHIKNTHHRFTREEVVRVSALLDKVCKVHGNNHPELWQIRTAFARLSQELTTHMMKEEMVLFPFITRLEEAVVENAPVLPAPFGTVQNPIAMMEHEHDSAGNALGAIRKASSDYSLPDDACFSYRSLYVALAAFESDLHQHIHLENNILFPRAIAMEKTKRR
ncbi:MAG TPA: iron-sulfur cluster repair di-iron protein [Terriglobales bacterium]|nr:iron-sulfur cluster repair di-iron protein [Terriglobales bacterium]